MPAEFLYNLTKNLTAHLQHKLCAVLPKTKRYPDLPDTFATCIRYIANTGFFIFL